MTSCVCMTVNHLASNFNEALATELVPALNQHLTALCAILSRSRSFSRNIPYNITPTNHRTSKLLSIHENDLTAVDEVCDRFKEDLASFWKPSNDPTHMELFRRLACVVIFLRSELDAQTSVPLELRDFVEGHNSSELRYAGKRYLKTSRRLDGIGAVFSLPLGVPSSTYDMKLLQSSSILTSSRYERYLTADDELTINHLKLICPDSCRYGDIVSRLITMLLEGPFRFLLCLRHNSLTFPSRFLPYNITLQHVLQLWRHSA